MRKQMAKPCQLGDRLDQVGLEVLSCFMKQLFAKILLVIQVIVSRSPCPMDQ